MKIFERLLDHTYGRLAAVAIAITQMRAKIKGVDLIGQRLAKRVVYSIDRALIEEAAADPRLICHHDQQITTVFQHLQCFESVIEEPQMIDRRKKIDFFDKCTVSVDKNSRAWTYAIGHFLRVNIARFRLYPRPRYASYIDDLSGSHEACTASIRRRP